MLPSALTARPSGFFIARPLAQPAPETEEIQPLLPRSWVSAPVDPSRLNATAASPKKAPT